jgi:hypothetical protein
LLGRSGSIIYTFNLLVSADKKIMLLYGPLVFLLAVISSHKRRSSRGEHAFGFIFASSFAGALLASDRRFHGGDSSSRDIAGGRKRTDRQASRESSDGKRAPDITRGG